MSWVLWTLVALIPPGTQLRAAMFLPGTFAPALGPLWLGLGAASAMLGVVWAAWHLPLFFIRGTDTTGGSFPVYLITVTAISIAMGWLYARTSGSLLLVMLMHSAANNTPHFMPPAAPGRV